MALTVITAPYTKDYIYNPSYFTLSSTNSSKLQFRYLADVYCSHSGTTDDIYVGQFDFPPRIKSNRGVFSPSRILQSYVTAELMPTIHSATTANGGVLLYNIYFGEEYDNSSSTSGATGTTQYTGLTSYIGNMFLNALKSYEVNNQLDMYDGVTNPGTAYFLTDWNFANGKKINTNEYEILTVFNSLPYRFDTLQIDTFDFSGGTIGQYQFGVSPSDQYRYNIPAGTSNWSFTETNLLTSSPDSIMNGRVKSYLITPFHSGTQSHAEALYIIQTACTVYTPVRLAWKNRMGGFDFFTFEMLLRENIAIKTLEWERHLDYDSVIGDRGRSVLHTDSTTKLSITTNWLTAVESEWLKNSLLNSHPYPEVYIISPSGIKLPVVLMDSNYEPKTLEQDRLISYTINLEYAFQK